MKVKRFKRSFSVLSFYIQLYTKLKKSEVIFLAKLKLKLKSREKFE